MEISVLVVVLGADAGAEDAVVSDDALVSNDEPVVATLLVTGELVGVFAKAEGVMVVCFDIVDNAKLEVV